jgi:diguanylate cyclase (GGDEF)-like protein
MADLDHFKRVNDTWGHAAGDVVLRKFAEILKTSCRSSDICGRMGGEEFLLAFTHASDQSAALVTERVRTRLAAAEFEFSEHKLSVTASFGVAGLKPRKPSDFNSLLSQADAALYSAKRQGRNRVETAPAAGGPLV